MRSRFRRVAWLALLAAAPAFGDGPDLARVESLIVERTNQFRSTQGLRQVHVNGTLARTARLFARYMAETDRYGHEADGKKPSERAERQGYVFCRVAENISYQYSSEDFATAELAGRYVEGWKNSPGHRRNMLDKVVSDTGVAVARSPKTGRYYAVQLFGRRLAEGC